MPALPVALPDLKYVTSLLFFNIKITNHTLSVARDEFVSLVSRQYYGRPRRNRTRLRGGRLAGVVVAAIVGAIIILLIILLLMKRRQRNKRNLAYSKEQHAVGTAQPGDYTGPYPQNNGGYYGQTGQTETYGQNAGYYGQQNGQTGTYRQNEGYMPPPGPPPAAHTGRY